MVNHDDDEEDQRPVVVRRPVYDAAIELRSKAKAGDPPAFEAAREKAAEFRAAGKTEDAAFWQEILDFLMWREGVSADTPTVILEPGETWDAEAEKVIRPRGRQRRSGKDFR